MGAVSPAIGYLDPAILPIANQQHGPARRRRISPEAGRALEILGHAIEYLADEYAHAGLPNGARNAHREAMQLLMSINRQIYFDCPLVPSWGQRWRSLLRVRPA